MSSPPPDAVVRYADHPDGIIDVHLPDRRSVASADSAETDLLVLLHGGFWRAEWDRKHTRPLADALRREGFVVATPEYRRTGSGGGWPATFDDVRRAVALAPRLLAGLGVRTATTTGLLGHSAGGHLALWLACEARQARLPLDRVVALAPVGDLRDAHRRNLDDGAVRDLVGEPFDAVDPAVRLRTDPEVSVIVLHGTEDRQVPLENSLGWATDHPFVELQVLPGVDHFALIDPTSSVWPQVRAAVAR